jgi:hypothetical protein
VFNFLAIVFIHREFINDELDNKNPPSEILPITGEIKCIEKYLQYAVQNVACAIIKYSVP